MIANGTSKKNQNYSRHAELVSASLKSIMCREHKAILKQVQDDAISAGINLEEGIK